MAQRTYRARIFVKQEDPKARGIEDRARSFVVQASQPDRAATIVRSKLEEAGADVRAISHGEKNEIIVTVGREPRKTTPATMVASVLRARGRR